MDRLGAVVLVALLVALAASAAVLRRLDRRRGSWVDALRDRFYLGVPWGTVTVVAFVLAVYLFVQDGRTDWSNPVTIPFRAWSYRYPLGVATASFSHAGPNHLLGNLSATLVLGPIAEFAWRHYPEADDRTPHPWLADPRVRAFVVFPGIVVLVGLVTSVFALGPVIGFSGVVFALAGFAIVRYPIATIVAVLGVHGAILTTVRAIQSPVVRAAAESSPPAPPWWATIAIQGHALGFLLGVLLAVGLSRRRTAGPDPVRLWLAILLFGFAQALWAVYWFGGERTYVLYRGVGVVAVVALTLVVTLAVTASDRPIVPARLRRDAAPTGRRRRLLELGFASAPADGTRSRSRRRIRRLVRAVAVGERDGRFSRRAGAAAAVVLVLAAISGPAVLVNAFVVDPGDAEGALSVADYEVAYDEGVENPLVSIAPVDVLGVNDTVTASGVIVWSDERHLWTDAVSADRLAFTGREEVHLGGPGWRETVTAVRAGWEVVGNDSAYHVRLESADGSSALAFESDPVTADAEVAGHRFAIVPTDGEFALRVRDAANETATVTLPDEGNRVSLGAVTVVREANRLYAETNATSVVIATEESYR